MTEVDARRAWRALPLAGAGERHTRVHRRPRPSRGTGGAHLPHRVSHRAQVGFFADHDEHLLERDGQRLDSPIDAVEARVRLPLGATIARLEAYTVRRGQRGRTTRRPGTARRGARHFAPRGPSPRTRGSRSSSGGRRESSASRRCGSGPSGGSARTAGRSPASSGCSRSSATTSWPGCAWGGIRGWRDRPAWEAPRALSGGVRYLKRMSFDDRGFAATLVQMAVKGHLEIEEKDRAFHAPSQARGPGAARARGERGRGEAVRGRCLHRAQADEPREDRRPAVSALKGHSGRGWRRSTFS